MFGPIPQTSSRSGYLLTSSTPFPLSAPSFSCSDSLWFSFAPCTICPQPNRQVIIHSKHYLVSGPEQELSFHNTTRHGWRRRSTNIFQHHQGYMDVSMLYVIPLTKQLTTTIRAPLPSSTYCHHTLVSRTAGVVELVFLVSTRARDTHLPNKKQTVTIDSIKQATTGGEWLLNATQ